MHCVCVFLCLILCADKTTHALQSSPNFLARQVHLAPRWHDASPNAKTNAMHAKLNANSQEEQRTLQLCWKVRCLTLGMRAIVKRKRSDTPSMSWSPLYALSIFISSDVNSSKHSNVNNKFKREHQHRHLRAFSSRLPQQQQQSRRRQRQRQRSTSASMLRGIVIFVG